ncbi:MAG: UDP-N-acetylmuramoyl-L-alanine--D-glutamate ligase [Vicinamibacterales bacterium]
MTREPFDLSGKHVVVLGAGRSGLAAVDLLVSRGATVTLSDTAAGPAPALDRLRALGVRVDIGPHVEDLLRRADLIVLSPGVSPMQAAVATARLAGVPVIGEVELASRFLQGRVIAVTGTKGKSTTTTLIARMLQRGGFTVTAGGNLGTALSTQVVDSQPDTIHVVEVSSFQLETIATFRPWIAVLLNLSADHLDRHATFDEYAASKARIFENQTADDYAVVNADDAAALALAGGIAKRFDFALDAPIEDGVTVAGELVVERRAGAMRPLFPVSAVRLTGRHLLADALAAGAVASLAGVPVEAMQRALATFTGLEHALEPVAEIGGVRFVNDSKATNIVAVRRSIESFDRGVVVIMGGRYKGGSFEDLRESLQRRATGVVAIGESAPLIHAALGDALPVRDAGSMAEAVREAFALAGPGGVVLLAPACSSFDMFPDYSARGRAFKDEVGKLAQDQGARAGVRQG